MSRPTIIDLATAAGVSLATVDRVLNSRPGVRQVTVEKVNSAVERIGFVRDPFAANLARKRDFKVIAFVPKGDGQFLTEICNSVRKTAHALAAERVDLVLQQFEGDDAHTLAVLLDMTNSDAVDGVVIMALETPPLRDSVRRLRARGVSVVAIISDLPNSGTDYFIGINNLAAGRTAGALMGRMLPQGPAKVAVMTSSLQAWDSLDRRLGFDQSIAEGFGNINVLATVEGHDDPATLDTALRRVLAAHPDLGGVYSMGGGNRVLLALLRQAGLTGKVRVIAHELTQTTRAGLRQDQIDAVITQDLGHIMRSAIRTLRAIRDQRPILAEQERIRIEILVKDNLD